MPTAPAQTAAAVREAGARAISLAVDVADPEGLQKAAATVESEFGGCHVLCANVGVQQFGSIDRLTEEDWHWVLDVNVISGGSHGRQLSCGAARVIGGASHPAHLFVGRSFTRRPLGAYTTSKFAVMGYGETLRQELAPEGIGVTILFPAGMSTAHLQSSARACPAELGPSVTLPAPRREADRDPAHRQPFRWRHDLTRA